MPTAATASYTRSHSGIAYRPKSCPPTTSNEMSATAFVCVRRPHVLHNALRCFAKVYVQLMANVQDAIACHKRACKARCLHRTAAAGQCYSGMSQAPCVVLQQQQSQQRLKARQRPCRLARMMANGDWSSRVQACLNVAFMFAWR